ncbi:beta-hydroxyacyl-ACP dehydratase [Trinickia terrae]|uniref:Beta-hydroxyacyl-ACP dehydratase n=1 Tax=Trinickia terrae TaxID=2571161 RepID=A0A4U1I1F2_9BURK|nr:AMP-binding protein [Trinickia terrae]TKC86997.1 beta-hydroxyacyl-ACP dehydratase [Trinickia terrae]
MPSFPLVSHSSLDETIAWCDGAPVSVRVFLADVARLAAALPQGGHVFNACKDRYRFAVGFGAALVAGKVSLLPSTHTPQAVRELIAFAPDTFCLYDADECAFELARLRFPGLAGGARADATVPHTVPQIDASRVAACIFTSGSTGTPRPHRKTWGSLVRGVQAGLAPLGLSGARGTTLVATVPPQHMYGFEHSVLLALIGGLAFSNRQPFYPADIRAALESVPEPRVLVTSPVHLRALLMSEEALPRTALILSATAPLSESLAAEAEARLAAPLVEIYGSTETGKIATRRTAQGPVWRLVPDVALRMQAAEHDAGGDAEAWAAGGHVEDPTPMGDMLTLLDGTHFLLQGRKADLINIAGKRTSLGYLNHQLTAIPGVTDGVFFMPDATASAHGGQHEPVARLAAFVVAPALGTADILRALRERIDAAFMPRPLVLVDALPRNEAGKLPRETLAALLASSTRSARRDQAQGGASKPPAQPVTFEIPLDHPALPGHFPGQPIVPGVVLLDHAISGIGRALDRELGACKISSAKFLSPALPGVPLALSFRMLDSGAIDFSVTTDSRTVATGVLSKRGAS